MAALATTSCTESTRPVPIATIQLQPGLDSIEVGGTYGFWVVTLKDAVGGTITGARKLKWESQNLAVATIDSSTGVVTAVNTGESLITVRGEGKFAQSAIRVIQPVLSIVVTPDSFDLPLTTARTIAVQLVGPGGVALTNRRIEWFSSTPGIAVVSTSGVVTAVSIGTSTITVRAGDKTATSKVRVVAEPVASVRILPAGTVHVIRVGQAKQFSAECLSSSQVVLPGRTVTWNSGNPVSATVTNNGFVVANSVGSASITASCENASASILAQVTPVPVASVTISPQSLSLQLVTPGPQPQGQLLATARDSANNVLSLQGRSVQWFTNNEPVARVSNTGVVTGASIGSAQIHVVVDGVASAAIPVDIHAFFSVLPGSNREVNELWQSSILASDRRIADR